MPYARKPAAGKEMDKRIAKVARNVVKAQLETKVGVSGFSGALSGWVPTAPLRLISISQGVGDNQRIGNEIRLQSIGFEGFLEWAPADVGAIRLFCVRSKKPTIDLSGINHIPATTSFAIDSDQYVTVYDRVIYRDTTVNKLQKFSFDINGRNARVRFDTGVSASPEWNYFVFFCGTPSTAVVNYFYRIKFTDA